MKKKMNTKHDLSAKETYCDAAHPGGTGNAASSSDRWNLPPLLASLHRPEVVRESYN